jgi:hypothetical protein
MPEPATELTRIKSEKETRGANGSLIFGGSLLGKEPSNGATVGSVGTSGTPPQGSVVKSRQARRDSAPRAVEKGAKFRASVRIEKPTSRPRGRKTRGVPVFFEARVESGGRGERRRVRETPLRRAQRRSGSRRNRSLGRYGIVERGIFEKIPSPGKNLR